MKNQWMALAILLCCVLTTLIGVTQVFMGVGVSSDTSKGGVIGSSSLAYIAIEGMIMEDAAEGGFFAQESSAVNARKMLYLAAEDDSVKGVLLRINSPGGTVGMSQELYDAVLAVRKQKPVVVSMGDVAASGGYYTAAAADKIVANPGTLTASIGVIMHSMNMEELLTKKLGVHPVTVKSGQFKDILSPYRPATAAEMTMLQSLIDTSYQQFITAVIEGRTKHMEDADKKAALAEQIRSVADGRVVIGQEALKVGLVDQLGGLHDAKRLLQKLSGKRFGISPKRLVLHRYAPSSGWLGVWETGFIQPLKGVGKAPLLYDKLPYSLQYANQPLWLMEGAVH